MSYRRVHDDDNLRQLQEQLRIPHSERLNQLVGQRQLHPLQTDHRLPQSPLRGPPREQRDVQQQLHMALRHIHELEAAHQHQASTISLLHQAAPPACLSPPHSHHHLHHDTNKVAWSPDGTLVASSSEDGKVRVWDALSAAQKSPPTPVAEEPRQRANWLVLWRTLPHWSYSKLAQFNKQHLGAEYEEDVQLSEELQRQAAAAVIEANMESEGDMPPASRAVRSQYHSERGSVLAQFQSGHQQLMDQMMRGKSLLLSQCLNSSHAAVQPVREAAGTAAEECVPLNVPVDVHPAVVLSCHRDQRDLMHRMRSWLSAHGMRTVDANQAPAGMNRSAFWFTACQQAFVVIPLLSKAFLFSRACGDELAYSAEHKKALIPFMCEPSYQSVALHTLLEIRCTLVTLGNELGGLQDMLLNPDNYNEQDEDIEIRMSTFRSLLNTTKHIPAKGSFDQTEEAFEANMQMLLSQLKGTLENTSLVDAIQQEIVDESDEGLDETIDEVIKELLAQSIADLISEGIERTDELKEKIQRQASRLRKLCGFLYTESSYTPDADMCTKVIKVPGSCSVLEECLSLQDLRVEAARCIKALCYIGAYPNHVMQHLVSLLEMLDEACNQSVFESESQKRKVHTSVLTLSYLTRCEAGKIRVYNLAGIPRLLKVVKSTCTTQMSKNQALQVLGDLVFIDMYGTDEANYQMLNCGVIPSIMAYVRSKNATEMGRKCSYFLMSHLCYHHAEAVASSGIVEHIVDMLNSLQSPVAQRQNQTIEGACRVLWALSRVPQTRNTLHAPSICGTLLGVLQLQRSDEVIPVEDQAPEEGYKMRAAAAIDELCSTDGTALQRLFEKIEETCSQSPMTEYSPLTRKVVGTLMWLSVQPRCNSQLRSHPKLLDMLWGLVKANTQYEYSLVILLVATVENASRIEELFNCKQGTGTVYHFIMGIFDAAGHGRCSRWAALCMALRLCGAWESITKVPAHNTAAALDTHFCQIRRGRFCQQLVHALVSWLQGAHPYKADAQLVLCGVVSDMSLFLYTMDQVLNKLDLLPKDIRQALQQVNNDLMNSTEECDIMKEQKCVLQAAIKALASR